MKFGLYPRLALAGIRKNKRLYIPYLLIIICRCEEITKGEIIQAIRDGATTVDGIKRMTRAGKGLCQGRTCRPLVEAILMAELGHLPPAEEYPSTRPPVRPMPLSALLAGEEDT